MYQIVDFAAAKVFPFLQSCLFRLATQVNFLHHGLLGPHKENSSDQVLNIISTLQIFYVLI